MVTRPRSAAGRPPAAKLKIRSSHSSRGGLRVSHRGIRDWKPPSKEADAVFDEDLVPGSPRGRD